VEHHTKGVLLVLCSGILFGTAGILSKILYSATTVGPVSLALFRLAFAIPMLSLFIAAKRYQVSLTRRDGALFATFGFFGITGFTALYFTSLTYTTVQHSSALLYTSPAFVAILSRMILKERLTRAKLVAIMLAISGAFFILGLARGEPLFASRTQIGDWLAVGAGLAYSSWAIFGKILGKNREPAVTSLLSWSFGAVFLFPLMVIREGFQLPQGLIALGLLAAHGIVVAGFAYLCYLAGLKLIDATKASVLAITEPLTATILAFLFFHETLSYDSLLGFVLIMSSILLASIAS